MDRGLVAKGGAKLLRRFTGGGTVVVNKDTLFSTLIIEVLVIDGVCTTFGELKKFCCCEVTVLTTL